MKSIVITDNKETIIGLRLSGIKGLLVDKDSDILSIIDKLINERKTGIIMITQNIFENNRVEIMKRKLKENEVLLVEIPGFNEKPKASMIIEYIQKSIGLNL